MTQGLLPGHRKGITCNRPKWKSVFLTNDINYILECQCGDSYVKKNKLIVLHIDTTDIDIEPMRYYSGGTYTISQNEFTCSKIHPEKIIKVIHL